jgi:hypothetical protein
MPQLIKRIDPPKVGFEYRLEDILLKHELVYMGDPVQSGCLMMRGGGITYFFGFMSDDVYRLEFSFREDEKYGKEQTE